MLLRLYPDNLDVLIILFPILIFSLCFHEFAHAYIAYIRGDKTAYYKGRLTLNPINHLDPIGTLMILLVGFGWAKPVPVNPNNLINRNTDIIKVAFAGPASNLILAFISGLIIRYYLFILPENILTVLIYFTQINIMLAVFNLLPIAPLDGSQIFDTLIARKNPELAWKLQKNGPIVLLCLILFGMITGISIIFMILAPFIKFFLFLFAGNTFGL